MEREYIVPLRREFQKAPKYKRTNRAVRALRDFISKHMKSETVLIGKHLNDKMWANGIRNPPHKVSVKAIKDSDGKVSVELKELPVVREKVNKRLTRVEKSENKKSEETKKDATKETNLDSKVSKESKKSEKTKPVEKESDKTQKNEVKESSVSDEKKEK